jgi:hypothetical protein
MMIWNDDSDLLLNLRKKSRPDCSWAALLAGWVSRAVLALKR